MKKLIIFGTGKIADVIFYYAAHECGLEIAAFTVDREYLKINTFNGLPVIPFDEVEIRYPASEYSMFIALGYHDMNSLRERKYHESRNKGYEIISIVSPYCKLPANVKYGENCFIMPPASIHPHVELGNNVFVFSGAMIGHHSKIGDNCWLTSCANISGVVTVGRNCFFAVNSTAGHGVTIGDECFIGANALVTKCLEPKKVVIVPATPVFKLESDKFLKLSKFSEL